MLPEWQTAKVIKIEQEAENTRRFYFQFNELHPFNFEPGQFVTLDLPIHEKKNKRWRSYSIASAPNHSNTFELVIVLVEDGLGTNYLFNTTQVGDEIILRGPQGHFTAPTTSPENLFLICTGTGIAPFRSMLQDWKNKEAINYKNVYLIMGTRTQKDLLFHNEMVTLDTQLPYFNYIPVLSREQWDGKMGYVHQVYEDLCQLKPEAEFMLCGWKNMIDEARRRIPELGYDKKMIHFELYG